jgi:hypothetical protein
MDEQKNTETTAAAAATDTWDDSDMKTSYANVVHVSSTPEEVTLLFGTNQTWRRGQPEFAVKLSDRVILSPFVAKRMAAILSQTIQRYEDAFGVIDVQRRVAAPQAPPSDDEESE